MPNIAVQAAAAGDAPDVGLPSAASTQDPVTIDSQPANDSSQTVSVEPSSGPTEIIVANYASPKFRFYIALVNTAIMTPIAAEVNMDTPSVSSPSVTTRDFVGPPRRRSCSMPNIHVWFCLADIKHVPSRDLIESSELGNFCTIAMHAASLLQQDSTEVRRCDATGPVTEAAAKPKRRSIWKRTKRFVRRLLCCV